MAEATKAPETPTDSPEAPAAGVKPTAGNRYRLFDDEGDYRIYEIAKKDAGLPKGTLLQIPEIPGFQSSAAARKWVNNSGNKLEGKQFLILKGLEIGGVQVETVTSTKVKWKPKTPIGGPAATEKEGP
jgi:hypothetical protein